MDGILTNKYFTLAILASLALMIYLYLRTPCGERFFGLEGMRNLNSLNYGNIGKELNDPEKERPWTDNVKGSSYGRVNKEKKLISKLEKKGYTVVKNDTESSELDSSSNMTPQLRTRYTGLPQPMDTRPDLSQCQPCNCDKK